LLNSAAGKASIKPTYKWSKDFLEAGKHRLRGDTMREANTSEVQELNGMRKNSCKSLHPVI